MTDSLGRFERDFLHPSSFAQWDDGPPFYLLDRLSGEERGQAEDLLIGALSDKNSWPALGLGHIRSTKGLPALYVWLEKSTNVVKILTAYAIYQINRDGRMVEVVLSEMPNVNEYSLTYVMFFLPAFDDLRIKELLQKYRRDERYLVAYNAARALGESTDAVVEEFRKKKSR